jgi:PAS domain S-box-containing protein
MDERGEVSGSGQSTSLASLIEEHRALLLDRWHREVKRQLAPAGLTQGELFDHVPLFIEELIATLRHLERLGVPGAAAQASEPAKAHGQQRFRAGFDVEAVVREYGVVNECVLDLAEAERYSISLPEVRVLSQSITTGIAEAVAEFQRDAAAERQESESRLRMAVKATDLGIWEMSPSTGALVLDTRTIEILGFRDDQAPTYEQFLSLLHPADRDRVHGLVMRALDPASGGIYAAEYRVRGPFGDRWIAAQGQAVFDDEDRAVRFIGTVLDIDEQRRQQRERERQMEFQQQFVSIVSHDLRSPFNAILLSGELLAQKATLNEDDRRLVAQLSSAARRGARMVRDLLDVTRTRLFNDFPMNKAPCDFAGVVSQAIEELRQAHPGRVIELEKISSGEGMWDADRLAQVVTNLASNALKFGRPDAPVRVAAAIDEHEATLTVWNQGPAIPAELRASLFELVKHRSTSAQGQREGSLGLGLYIVHQIVLAHGGRIEVDSAEPRGTTFTVRLPRRTAAPKGHHPPM